MEIQENSNSQKLLRSKRGSALMMAIFTVTLLMVISTEIVYQVSVESLISAQGVHGVQAYYAAKSGAEISLLRIHLYLKALSQFGSSLPNKSVLDMIWQVPFSWPPPIPPGISTVDKGLIQEAIKKSQMKAQYVTSIEPETGKIDINDLAGTSMILAKAAHDNLLQIFQEKVTNDDAFSDKYRGFDFSKLVDAIRFYATTDKDDANGLLSAYGTRANDFMPPHRPYQTISELHFVPGLTDELFDLIKDRVTVYGAKGINVNYATKTVLMSLGPKIVADVADKIIADRNDPNRGPYKDLNDFMGELNKLGVPNAIDQEKDQNGNLIPPPLYFDSEINFRIHATGVSGKVSREVTAVVYDLDRVKARAQTFFAPAVASGSGVSGGSSASTGTNPAAGPGVASGSGGTSSAPPINVPNERPNVVYWSEN